MELILNHSFIQGEEMFFLSSGDTDYLYFNFKCYADHVCQYGIPQ